MTTDTTTVDTPAGRIEIECAVCGWTQPTGRWADPGTAERPGCADYVDAVIPLIGAHIDGTGHSVRVTLTTCWPDYNEQSVPAGGEL